MKQKERARKQLNDCRIEPKRDGCIFTATLYFRMGWLFSIFAKDRVEAIKKHMKEEGENLKNILEKGGI